MNLKDKAKKLPSSPGVYLMKDSSSGIIYVGKSKNLRSRVQSYLQRSKVHSKKVEKLVNHLKDFDYILTDTEFEAFILECQLIKKLQPIYNKLMKSPQSYTYIMFQMDKKLPSIELTNHINENDGSLYFGPYTSKSTVEKVINGLKDFYKMNCNDPFNKYSPCFNYTLGLCSGICFKSLAMKEYHHIITRFIALLDGTDISILEEMNKKMIDASNHFDFERAARIRDTIEVINSLLKKEKVIEFTKENKYIVVSEFIDDHKMKLFLISRNIVLYSQIYEIDYTKFKQLSLLIKGKILAHFHSVIPLSSINISRDEIDEAQIIYSYLNSDACEYLIIPEKWLYTENHEEIDTAINDFLYSKFVERRH